MRRLIRGDRERGAMAIIVAIFVPVILIGFGAIILDVGSWYSSRSQDQNGADAAVIAVANSCSPGPACTASVGTKYANSSSNGGLAQQVKVCGSVSSSLASGATGLVTCASLGIPEDGKACPTAPASGIQYVDAFVQPKNTDSSGTINSFVGYGKQSIAACAQAIIGQSGGGTGLALTMSLCAWQEETGGSQNSYASPAPPYPANGWPAAYPATVTNKIPAVPNLKGENVVQIHGDAKACNDSSSGLNLPGGFGWLEDTSGNCTTTTTANGYVLSNPGNDFSTACKAALAKIYSVSKGGSIPNSVNPIYVPVFDHVCDSSGNYDDGTSPCPLGMPKSSYHITGYALFVLTGYDINPDSAKSLISNTSYCKGGTISCMYGMFVQGLVKAPGTVCTSGCANYGPVVIKLNG